ncbi:MAG: tyrosine phosphatase family protein [Rhizobiaceae bacterium]|nr:tyrosine phosphatase family protein [Rhizobiaceae bacterium]
MPRIIVSPLKSIAEMAARHKAREMITLIAEKHDFHRPGIIDPSRHLAIAVNDIAFAGRDGLVAPQEAHVAAIVDFARGWDRSAPLLVHCWMGVSRSPAAALIAALATDAGLDDDALARALRRASPQASPNSRLIEIGDAALCRSGRLVAAVKAIGRGADYQGDAPFLLDF